MLTTQQFLQFRQQNTNQFLAADNPDAPTIMVTSHIWWTDFIAHALHQLGYNVLLVSPLYLLFTDKEAWPNFDSLYDQYVAAIKQYKVCLILGGNSTAMVPHPKTGILLHDAANVPVVHYWWDEPRTRPPCMKHSGTPADYLAHLQNAHTLNVWWDIDVKEEMAAFYQVPGIHAPLATTPDFWPDTFIPLEARRIAACFLGNCHGPTVQTENRADPLLNWANTVIDHKLNNLDLPMIECLQRAHAAPSIENQKSKIENHFTTGCPAPANPLPDPWSVPFLDWELLNLVYMHRTRNLIVQALKSKLGDYFCIVGKGWEQLGLKPNKEHSGLPAAGDYYANARASLNLFGGCVHGGMPLRPYEIAASHGLILTHYNRELPNLFEPGKECLAFKNADELIELLDRLLKDPRPYNALIPAARARTLAHHTWQNRLRTVLDAARLKFNL